MTCPRCDATHEHEHCCPHCFKFDCGVMSAFEIESRIARGARRTRELVKEVEGLQRRIAVHEHGARRMGALTSVATGTVGAVAGAFSLAVVSGIMSPLPMIGFVLCGAGAVTTWGLLLHRRRMRPPRARTVPSAPQRRLS